MEALFPSPPTRHTWGAVMANGAAMVPVAVDEAQFRFDGKPIDGPLHRQHPGIEDVQLVDLLRRDSGHAAGDGGLGDGAEQGIPPLRRQLLGVVEAGEVDLPGQYDARRRTPGPPRARPPPRPPPQRAVRPLFHC